MRNLIATGAVLFLLAAALSCQSSFVYFPEPALVATPASVGLAYESVDLRTEDGVTLHAWWIPSPEERGVVLFCHGNGGNISYYLQTAEIYRRMRLSSLIFDYRGYGRSGGTPSETGTYRDADAAWNYLAAQRGIDPRRIIIHGRSLGGSIASWLAARHTPAMLIAESTFTTIRSVARQHCSFSPALLMLTYRYATIDYIRAVRSPVLVIHSVNDELIPFSEGRALFEAAAEPKEFIELRGSHNFGIIQSAHAYEEGMRRFIDRYLRVER